MCLDGRKKCVFKSLFTPSVLSEFRLRTSESIPTYLRVWRGALLGRLRSRERPEWVDPRGTWNWDTQSRYRTQSLPLSNFQVFNIEILLGGYRHRKERIFSRGLAAWPGHFFAACKFLGSHLYWFSKFLGILQPLPPWNVTFHSILIVYFQCPLVPNPSTAWEVTKDASFLTSPLY